MNTYAVGDLHGHFNQWMRLYLQLLAGGLKPEKDVIVFLGDYIDGGPQAKQVVQWLMDYKKKYPHWQMIYGNHEDLMLDALDYGGEIYGSYDLWYQQGGKATYESYIPKGVDAYSKAIMQVKDTISKEHRDWLMALPVYYENEKYFFVHAGVDPRCSLKEFIKKIDSGDKNAIEIALWIRYAFIDSKKNWGKKIVYGHTTEEWPNTQDNKIGIDGMFHNKGNLFAVKLPSEKLFSEPSGIS